MPGNIPGTSSQRVYRRDLLDPIMRFTGAWNAITIYLPGDVISDGTGNATYVCIAQNNNQAPPNTTYWTKL